MYFAVLMRHIIRILGLKLDLELDHDIFCKLSLVFMFRNLIDTESMIISC